MKMIRANIPPSTRAREAPVGGVLAPGLEAARLLVGGDLELVLLICWCVLVSYNTHVGTRAPFNERHSNLCSFVC